MGRIEDAIRKLEKARHTAPPSVRIRPDRDPRASAVAEFSLDACAGEIRLDEQRLERWGPVIWGHDSVGSKSEYAAIKRPVIDLALGRRMDRVPEANLVLVTSAVAGEGKTLIALNLALSISRERDLSVLLVDGDVASGSLTRLFSMVDNPGLTDLIDDERYTLEQVVHATTIPDLFFLPAGAKKRGALELLSSRRMEMIAQSLSSSSRNLITVFDSSPLLLTTESKQLAALAGQIVFVVRAGETSRALVGEALEFLGSEKPVNQVLNGSAGSEMPQYGHDYGGYTEDDAITLATEESP